MNEPARLLRILREAGMGTEVSPNHALRSRPSVGAIAPVAGSISVRENRDADRAWSRPGSMRRIAITTWGAWGE